MDGVGIEDAARALRIDLNAPARGTPALDADLIATVVHEVCAFGRRLKAEVGADKGSVEKRVRVVITPSGGFEIEMGIQMTVEGAPGEEPG